MFVMSTHLPLSAFTTSPGRVEWGPGMFSTAGATARSRVPGGDPGDRGDGGDHGGRAPILSIFISSIRSAGLMLMPPESKPRRPCR